MTKHTAVAKVIQQGDSVKITPGSNFLHRVFPKTMARIDAKRAQKTEKSLKPVDIRERPVVAKANKPGFLGSVSEFINNLIFRPAIKTAAYVVFAAVIIFTLGTVDLNAQSKPAKPKLTLNSERTNYARSYVPDEKPRYDATYNKETGEIKFTNFEIDGTFYKSLSIDLKKDETFGYFVLQGKFLEILPDKYGGNNGAYLEFTVNGEDKIIFVRPYKGDNGKPVYKIYELGPISRN